MNRGMEALIGRIRENLFDLNQVTARITQIHTKADRAAIRTIWMGWR